MFHRRFLAMGAPILAAAALLFTAGDVFAQRGGGGGHGGGGGGHGGGGGGGWHGGGGGGGARAASAYHGSSAAYHGSSAAYHGSSSAYHGNNGNWHGNNGNWHGDHHGDHHHGDHFALFIGFGGYYPGWGYGYGWGFPYYYGYSYPYYDAGYYYGPSYYPDLRDYSVPDTSSSSGVTQTNAMVDVRLPKSDATVWLEGVKTQQTGTERSFVSPTLAAGKTYSYEVHARWTDDNGAVVDRIKTVPVHSGERVMVDFTLKTQMPVPAPAPRVGPTP
jgi:uncharacterized protein (TIGR03000 family)